MICSSMYLLFFLSVILRVVDGLNQPQRGTGGRSGLPFGANSVRKVSKIDRSRDRFGVGLSFVGIFVGMLGRVSLKT